jgi:hypothetical protein
MDIGSTHNAEYWHGTMESSTEEVKREKDREIENICH